MVEKETLLAGDTITDARVRPGTVGEGPYVAFELNASGAELFERITADNVGRRLAIILDSTVYSAPVIRERIPGGRASIEGTFDIKEARDLAIVLRVDPEEAVRRKPEDDADYVRARATEIWTAKWNRPGVHVLDAGRPKDEVLADVRRVVWAEL